MLQLDALMWISSKSQVIQNMLKSEFSLKEVFKYGFHENGHLQKR